MNLCTYCGALANERDHLKPRKYGDRTAKLAFGSIGMDLSHIKTVPCCRDCNWALHGCADTDVRERALFLALKYEAKPDADPARLAWMRAVALLET
jgi:hypothetical protein